MSRTFGTTFVESHDGYFIGSMVIYTDGDASGLVDGQQRFATITILLAALRNKCGRSGAATRPQVFRR